MSQPQFQARHQDYVVGPNQDPRLASVAPGQLITGIEFQTDTDAPFLLRGRAYRVSYDSIASHTQLGLQNVAMRFAGPDQDFRSRVLVPQGLVMPYGGQSAAWKPVYPQIFYPARSTMTIEVQNLDPTNTLTNLTLYWRGVKLYPWGRNEPTYPRRMEMTQYAYGINRLTPQPITNPTEAIQNLLTSDLRYTQTFQVKNDADFVVRSLQAGPSYPPLGLEVFLVLRDENQKAYSNDWMHFEVLCGPSTGNYQSGAAGSIPAIGTGNALPGVLFPEFYLPANHVMYYDVMRADSGYAGAATIPNFPVQLFGSRVRDLGGGA